LDKTIWEQVLRLFEDPELIRQEIQRRIQEIQDSNPTKKRKEVLDKQIAHQQKGIDKLIDAYQEGLLELDELRNRMPDLRKRKEALLSELRTIESAVTDQQTFLRMADNIEGFLERLRGTADNLDVLDRKKILRLVVKEVLVFKDTIKIKHSIPITAPPRTPDSSGAEKGLSKSYLLRSWSPLSAAIQHPARRTG
jgi:site-specific DNA recombinase